MYMDFAKVYRFTRYFLNPLFAIKIEACIQKKPLFLDQELTWHKVTEGNK